MKINAKKKLNTVLSHAKAHPIPYVIVLTSIATTAIRYVYDSRKGMVFMDDVVKDMTETGKGMYFKDTKTGTTVVAALYNPETMPGLKFLD
jgi:hypothetical protein